MKKIFLVSLLVLFTLSFFAFDASDYLNSVNKSIDENNASWKADFKSDFLEKYVNASSSFEEMNGILNQYIFLPAEMRNRIFSNLNESDSQSRMTTTDDLLWSFLILLRPEEINVPTFYRLEPVRDQYLFGSCWAFSTLGAFESAQAVQLDGKQVQGNVENKYDYSERWVGYHNINWATAPTQGWFTFHDKDQLSSGNSYFSHYNGVRYGMIEEVNAPYSDVFISNLDGIPLPTRAYTAPRTHSSKAVVIPTAAEARGLGYTYEEYTNMIKTAIYNLGSVSVSYAVPGDFNGYSHGIYTPTVPQSNNDGGHAVTLVGWVSGADLADVILGAKVIEDDQPIMPTPILEYTYNDAYVGGVLKTATEFWIVKNSWGYSWGDGGYFVIPVLSEDEYNGTKPIGTWHIQSRWMFVPVFESAAHHTETSLDINKDGKVDKKDFDAIVALLGQDSEDGDIAYPKDGKVTPDDISTWVYLYNLRNN